jgi:hypothetical protein
MLRLTPDNIKIVADEARKGDTLWGEPNKVHGAIANAQLIHACKMFREFLEDYGESDKPGIAYGQFEQKYGPDQTSGNRNRSTAFDAWLKHEGIEKEG